MKIMSEEDNNKKKNLKALMGDGRSRSIIFITGGVLAGVVVLGLMSAGKTQSSKSPIEGSASVDVPLSVTAVPGTSTSADYNRLQQEQNQRDLQAAQAAGQTYLPVITGNTSGSTDPITLPPIDPPANPTQPPSQPTQPVAQQAQIPTQTPPSAQIQQAPTVPSDQMMSQISGYLALWGPANNAKQEFVYVGTKPAAAQAQTGSAAGSQGSGVSDEKSVQYARAGTMVSALLLTPMSSDAPGPVLAEITSGPLSGARLLGTMALNKEAIGIRFSTISRPGWPKSYSVNAVGMDERLSTALATDVNRHSFSRYTALLGGTFLEAYGIAMGQTGESIIITSGGIVSDQPDLTQEQALDSAYGAVLGEMGQEWQQRANIPATVTVEGQDGSALPIKILFTSDF